jgi:hypothetical protein
VTSEARIAELSGGGMQLDVIVLRSIATILSRRKAMPKKRIRKIAAAGIPVFAAFPVVAQAAHAQAPAPPSQSDQAELESVAPTVLDAALSNQRYLVQGLIPGSALQSERMPYVGAALSSQPTDDLMEVAQTKSLIADDGWTIASVDITGEISNIARVPNTTYVSALVTRTTNGTYDHAMTVTGKSPGGEPLLSYHTNNVYNSPRNVIISKPGDIPVSAGGTTTYSASRVSSDLF